jgi:hypothetical protein
MAHGLSDAQLAACMAPNAAWPHAARDDGWVLAHDALRADMADLHAAVDALLAHAAAGRALTAWQARARRGGNTAAGGRARVARVHAVRSRNRRRRARQRNAVGSNVRVRASQPSAHASSTVSAPPAAAQVKTLQADWARFSAVTHFHHKHEEQLVFPFMAKRIVVPPKLSADHKARTRR